MEGVYARLPIGDLTIGEAYEHVADPSFWDETMPLILFHFSVADYWSLKVIDHRRLYDWLVERGLG